MPLILAIEPDPDQAAAVRRAVRGVGSADLVLVDTREAALAALADSVVPEMVLVSALLKPADEAALAARLRARRDAAHVEMITIPLLEAEPGKPEKRGGLLGLFKKKQARDDRQGRVSPRLFANEIKKHLERVRESHPEETREGALDRGPAELPESVERLTLPPELTDAETALSNRMARLKEFNHQGIQRTRGLEHDAATNQLVLVADRVPGLRASEMLTRASNCSLVADLPAALFVMRRLLSTLGSLHAATGIAHVGVTPQRIVITPRGEVVVVEAALAGAHAGTADQDSRTDIAQMAKLGLSMVLGHTVNGNEDADARSHLLAEVSVVAVIRVSDDFATLLRSWFASALATDEGESFTGFDDAAMALERVEASGCVGSRRALKAFAKDLAFETFHAPAAAAIEAQRIRATRARQIEKRNASPGTPRRARWRDPDFLTDAVAQHAAPAVVPAMPQDVEDACAHVELEPAETVAAEEPVTALFTTPIPEPAETFAPVAAAASEAAAEPVWLSAPEPVGEIEIVAAVEEIATIVPDAWEDVTEDITPEIAAAVEETAPVAYEIAEPIVAVEEVATIVPDAWEEVTEEVAAPIEVEPPSRVTSLFDRFRAVTPPEAPPAAEPTGEIASEIAAAVEEIDIAPFVAELPEQIAEVELVAADEETAPPLDEVVAPVAVEPPSRFASLFGRFRAFATPEAPPTLEPTEDVAPEIVAAAEEMEIPTIVAHTQEESAEVEVIATVEETAAPLDEVAAPVEAEPPSRPTEAFAPEIAAAVEEIAALMAATQRQVAEAEVVAAVEETAPPLDEIAAPDEAEPPSRVTSLFGRFRAFATPEPPPTPDPVEDIAPEIAAALEETVPVLDEIAEPMAAVEEIATIAEAEVAATVEEIAPPPDEVAAPVEAEPLSLVTSRFDRFRAVAIPEALSAPEPTADVAPEIGAAVEETVAMSDEIAELIAAVDEITTTAEAVAADDETATPLNEVASRGDEGPVRDTPEEIEFEVPEPNEAPAVHKRTPAIAAAPEETAETAETAPPDDDFVQEMLRNIAASNTAMGSDGRDEIVAAPEPSIAEAAEEIAEAAEEIVPDAEAAGGALEWFDTRRDEEVVCEAPIALNEVARVDVAERIETAPPPDAREEVQGRGASLLGLFRLFRGGRTAAVQTAAPVVVGVEPLRKAPAAAPRRAEPGVRVRGPVTRKAAVPERSSQWPRVAAVLLIGTGLVAGGGAYYLQETTPETTTAAKSAPTGKPNPKAGRLAVTSEPPGAKVTVDGKFRGVTPLTIPDLPLGSHAVVLDSSAGSVRRTVTIKAGGEVALNESIYEGYLMVFAPFEVRVSEGKRLLGTTESGKMMLSSGRHQLVLANRVLGYREARVVDINPGETVSVNVKTVEGIVRVTAAPGTEVLIDGQPVGTTPLGDLRVAVGSREIVLKNPQLGERRTVVDVTLAAPVEVKFQ